jgi:integrase
MQLDRKGNRVKTRTRTAGHALDIGQALVNDQAAHFERRHITDADLDTLVFRTPAQYSRLHYSNWRRQVWVPACRRAGLTGLGFHDLRRNNATTMHDVGLPVKVARERLRHKKSSTTLDIYTKASKRGGRGHCQKNPAG